MPILSDETFLKSFGKAVTLLFLPYLFAFLLQSDYLLRIYIALLVAPSPAPSDLPESDRTPTTCGRKWRIISATLVLSILSVVQFNTVLQHLSLQAVAACNKYLIYICLFITVASITVQISHPGEVIVHRTSNGQYEIVNQGGIELQKSNQRPILTSFLACSIVIFAFLMVSGLSESSSNLLPTAVATMAYVANATTFGRGPLRPFSILYTVSLMVLVVAILVMLKYAETSSVKFEQETVWTTNTFNSVGYIHFLPAAMGSFLSGPVIACALRFDFMKTLVDTEPGPNLSHEVTKLPTDNQSISKGIIVPQSLPYKFPKPYYTLTLTTWSIIRIATLVLCLATGFPLKSPYDACQLAILFEFPIMTVALFIFAAIRGEARTLWNYKEKWTLNFESSCSVLTVKERELLLARNEDGMNNGTLLV